MITELIAKVFADRDMAHLEHLQTRSYAAHMATGAFYEDVIGALDATVESYIGTFGPFDEVPVADRAAFSVEALQETADWIEVNRMEIANDHNAIANLVDAVTAVYMSAIYKLSRFN